MIGGRDQASRPRCIVIEGGLFATSDAIARAHDAARIRPGEWYGHTSSGRRILVALARRPAPPHTEPARLPGGHRQGSCADPEGAQDSRPSIISPAGRLAVPHNHRQERRGSSRRRRLQPKVERYRRAAAYLKLMKSPGRAPSVRFRGGRFHTASRAPIPTSPRCKQAASAAVFRRRFPGALEMGAALRRLRQYIAEPLAFSRCCLALWRVPRHFDAGSRRQGRLKRLAPP